MSKIAVVYWSGTGNTETMANAVVEGVKAVGVDTEEDLKLVNEIYKNL